MESLPDYLTIKILVKKQFRVRHFIGNPSVVFSVYGKFRDSFQFYQPPLEPINAKFDHWQVNWFWEDLVKIPITADTY